MNEPGKYTRVTLWCPIIIRSCVNGLGTDLKVQSIKSWSEAFKRFMPSKLAQKKQETKVFSIIQQNFPLKNGISPLIILHNGGSSIILMFGIDLSLQLIIHYLNLRIMARISFFIGILYKWFIYFFAKEVNRVS